MLIWLVIFFIILGISFILALRSMADYKLQPSNFKTSYSLFLVTKPSTFNAQIITQLHQAILPDKLILSLEKLVKGSKQALVIFGPTQKLLSFTDILGLMELEDYSQKTENEILAWEVGTKPATDLSSSTSNILSEIPPLGESEQLWWQVVASPLKEEKFEAGIRAILQTQDRKRALLLQQDIQKATQSRGLFLLPQPYSNQQIIAFYRKRTLSVPDSKISTKMIVSKEELLSLLH